MSSRTIYVDCTSSRQQQLGFSHRWAPRRQEFITGEEHYKLLDLLDSMRRVHATLTEFEALPDEGLVSEESESEHIDEDDCEYGDTTDFDYVAEEFSDGEEDLKGSESYVVATTGKSFMESKKSYRHQSDGDSLDPDEDVRSSACPTFHGCSNSSERDNASFAESSLISPVNVFASSLGRRIEIPRLQLDLIQDHPGLTRRTQSHSHTLSTHSILSPHLSKKGDKLYEQLQDLELRICDNVRALGERLMAQKEKSDCLDQAYLQLAGKYERAIEEIESLEKEVLSIRSQKALQPSVSLYDSIMSQPSPRFDETEESHVSIVRHRTCSSRHVSDMELPFERRGHKRAMSVQAHAEIRFIRKEQPKPSIGVGDSRVPQAAPRRYRSVENEHLYLEGASPPRARVTVPARQPHRDFLPAQLFQRVRATVAKYVFKRQIDTADLRPFPYPRIVCGESL